MHSPPAVLNRSGAVCAEGLCPGRANSLGPRGGTGVARALEGMGSLHTLQLGYAVVRLIYKFKTKLVPYLSSRARALEGSGSLHTLQLGYAVVRFVCAA